MADDVVLYETDGPVATVTMNRPEQLNALTHENQTLRKEQAEIREVFGKVREQMAQMLQPIGDIVQRLQTTARPSG